MCLIVLCFLSLCYMCIYLFDCYSMYMLFANKEFIHSFILYDHDHQTPANYIDILFYIIYMVSMFSLTIILNIFVCYYFNKSIC